MLECYKKAGFTPLQFINTIKKVYPEQKVCYTARLDPMARGIVPILIGDECKRMDSYTSLSKTYEVKIIIGFSTDSDDALGMLQSNLLKNEESKTELYLQLQSPMFLTDYKSYFDIEKEMHIEQKFHYYSTKALMSRSKHNYEDHYHNVKLLQSTLIDKGEMDFNVWVNECIQTIDTIDKTKNFRQKEIIEQWQNILYTENIKTLPYITLQLHVGSGFFIRQHIRDISEKIGIPLMCYDIHRISIDY